MARRRDDMTIRDCGCVTYAYGPPLKCDHHAKREQEKEEKGLRKLVKEQATSRGHSLTQFQEYESCRGKWTAYCVECGAMMIVYDEPPVRGDQINGKRILEKDCDGSLRLSSTAAGTAREHGLS